MVVLDAVRNEVEVSLQFQARKASSAGSGTGIKIYCYLYTKQIHKSNNKDVILCPLYRRNWLSEMAHRKCLFLLSLAIHWYKGSRATYAKIANRMYNPVTTTKNM